MSENQHRFGDLLSAVTRLTSAQHALLTLVSNHCVPVTVTQLAKESGLHASSVRETIDALYSMGLVMREQLPVSGRGRPALGYLTLAPTDPGFAAQLFEQGVRATLDWLRTNAPDPARAAYDIGATWGDQAASEKEASADTAPRHLGYSGCKPGDLDRQTEEIRRFLTLMGFSASSHPTIPFCLVLCACPYTDPVFPDSLALELRRGVVEKVVEAKTSGGVDVHISEDPNNPIRVTVTLSERSKDDTSHPAQLNVRFYGAAAEAVETDTMTLADSSLPETLGALIDRLVDEFPEFAPVADISSFLVDDHEADSDTVLSHGAVVEVLPPFGGG